jgi:aspartate racemase
MADIDHAPAAELPPQDDAAPLIGILGGMGPLAAVDLMQKLIVETAALSDQQQIPVVCWNVPQVPDRQRALAGHGASPLAAMQAGVAALNAAGASRIVIACNTAHYWFDALASGSRAPLIHIVDATLEMMRGRGSAFPSKVGLIATQGTLDADLYQSRLARLGIDCLLLTPLEMTQLFTPGCYAVKQGRMQEAAALMEAAAQCLVQRGAGQLLLACTEVPLALAQADPALRARMIDPAQALAQACARYWRGSRAFQALAGT